MKSYHLQPTEHLLIERLERDLAESYKIVGEKRSAVFYISRKEYEFILLLILFIERKYSIVALNMELKYNHRRADSFTVQADFITNSIKFIRENSL